MLCCDKPTAQNLALLLLIYSNLLEIHNILLEQQLGRRRILEAERVDVGEEERSKEGHICIEQASNLPGLCHRLGSELCYELGSTGIQV